MAVTDQNEAERGRTRDHGQSYLPSPLKGRGRSVAMLYARNCFVVMGLVALLAFGTSVVSKNNNFPAVEQVVQLGENVDRLLQSSPAKPDVEMDVEFITLDSNEETKERHRKGRRKRPHRIIKNHHPENIVETDSKRRLMGRSRGGRYGGGGMMSGGYSRSYARTFNPTQTPSASPSRAPAGEPSARPSAQPSAAPSAKPSIVPSAAPSFSKAPSSRPSRSPSLAPSVSFQPTISREPSAKPSVSFEPSAVPSIAPTPFPTVSTSPSSSPSRAPSAAPSSKPSRQPSNAPSFVFRTFKPTISPTEARGTQFPTFERGSGSRSGMGGGMGGGMGMMGRGRDFRSFDQDEFDNQLNDIIAFLPQDFLALFGNNRRG